MNRKTRKAIAGAISLVVIIAAGAFRDQNENFAMFLFPGDVINLVFQGVHGNWDTPVGQVITFVPSAVFWFVVAYVGVSMFNWLFLRKKNEEA
jgi:hypothetical protein